MSRRGKMTPIDTNKYLAFQERYRLGEWRAIIFRDMLLADCGDDRKIPVMLDIGCGNGFDGCPKIQRQLSNVAEQYIGIEPDMQAGVGDYFTMVHRCQLEDCKLDAQSVDLAFSVMVLEHVRDPTRFWNKLLDAMKPGGVFWGFTADRRHFFCWTSMLAERLQIKELLLNGLRGERGKERYENFATYYRANSPNQIRSNVESRATVQFVNFSRVGQLDYYYPKMLVPLGRGIDRILAALNLPGSILAVRIQKK